MSNMTGRLLLNRLHVGSHVFYIALAAVLTVMSPIRLGTMSAALSQSIFDDPAAKTSDTRPTTVPAAAPQVSGPPEGSVVTPTGVIDIRRDGAFGFPQAKARVLFENADFRVSAWSDDKYLLVQAVVWAGDGETRVQELVDAKGVKRTFTGMDLSGLVFDVTNTQEAGVPTRRCYYIQPNSFSCERWSTMNDRPTYMGMPAYAGRGAIRYVASEAGKFTRIDSFLIPILDVNKTPGNSVSLAYIGYSAKSNQRRNSIGVSENLSHISFPLEKCHVVALSKEKSTFDPKQIPIGQVTPRWNATPVAGNTPAGGGPPPVSQPEVPAPRHDRRAIPSEADQVAARKVMIEIFRDLPKDRSPETCRKFSEELLAEADKIAANKSGQISGADHYVLLTTALDAAEATSDLRYCFRVIDRLDAAFQIDVVALRLDAASKLPDNAYTVARNPLAAKNVLSALDVVEQLISAKNYPAASKLAGTLELWTTGDPAYHAVASKRKQQVDAAWLAVQPVEQSLAALKTSPADPAANLTAGSYYCFVKDRWDAGLPLLAKGSDALLAKAATDELATHLGKEVQLGDEWWAAGETQKSPIQGTIRAHAVGFYKLALDHASVLARKLMEQRIADVGNAQGTAQSQANEVASKKPKKFVFLCQASGSKSTAVAALRDDVVRHVNALQAGEGFNVIVNQAGQFYPAFPGLAQVSAAGRRQAIAFLQSKNVRQGTNDPVAAVASAIALKPDAIAIFTDGDWVDPQLFLDYMRKANPPGNAVVNVIFCVEPGIASTAVDITRTIALESGGTWRAITPDPPARVTAKLPPTAPPKSSEPQIIAFPLRIATNGLCGKQFIDPVAFGPDWRGNNRPPGDPRAWLTQGAFARPNGNNWLVYPKLPTSRFVFEADVEFLNKESSIEVYLGEFDNAPLLKLAWTKERKVETNLQFYGMGIIWGGASPTYDLGSRVPMKVVVGDGRQNLVINGRAVRPMGGFPADCTLRIKSSGELGIIHSCSLRPLTEEDCKECGWEMPPTELTLDDASASARLKQMAVGLPTRPKLGAPFVAATTGTPMAWAAPGEFDMGSHDPKAIHHHVRLTYGFWIARTEVTQGDYVKLTSSNPSRIRGSVYLPVDSVSWNAATKYCTALTTAEQRSSHLPTGYIYRLPTEAEWEYACRAGSTDDFSVPADQIWSIETSGGRPHLVAEHAPNPWGLYDMHGNAMEWCLDAWHEFPAAGAADAIDPFTRSRPGIDLFVCRGGAGGDPEMRAPAFGVKETQAIYLRASASSWDRF